jgi:transposase
VKKAPERLEKLRTFDGRPLPPNAKASLERRLARHRLLSQQRKEIEAARERVLAVADPDRVERMIQLLAGGVGVGVETATTLAHEVFSRRFRDRKGLAGFVGVTGAPSDSGGSKREQGSSQERQSARAQDAHAADVALADLSVAKRARPVVPRARPRRPQGRMKTIMAVALARKLLAALWSYVETGVIPDGARRAAA